MTSRFNCVNEVLTDEVLHEKHRSAVRSGAHDPTRLAGIFMFRDMTPADRKAEQQRQAQKQAREAGCVAVVRQGPGPDRPAVHAV